MFRPSGHYQVHEHKKYTKESGLIPREAVCVQHTFVKSRLFVKVNVRVAF